MNWRTAGDAKNKIETAIKDIESLVRKFDSSLMTLDESDDCFDIITTKLKQIAQELADLEEELLNKSLTMGQVYNYFN
ncbi:MAG: hypothetical protein IJ475_02950 [Bacilli bacterium]|nr:hypothetical protein [Bacilli bacterium]